MPEGQRKSSRWMWIGAPLALAFVLAARSALPHKVAPAPAASAPAAPASTAPGPVAADVKRYQVPVTISQPSKGPKDALVTVVEWCALLSPECRSVDPIVDSALKQYGAQVRLVFRHFPWSQAPSPLPDEFSEIAYEQADKFWEARDVMRQGPTRPSMSDFEAYSKQLGLDWPAVRSALEKHTHSGHVAADIMFAQMFEVDAAPALFVNGRRLEGAVSLAGLKALIDDEIHRATKLVAQGIAKDKVYAELTKNGAWKQVPVRRN